MSDGTHRVKLVQEILDIPQTGIFDERTKRAVRNFQLENKLKIDPRVEQYGTVGPVTWAALVARAKS